MVKIYESKDYKLQACIEIPLKLHTQPHQFEHWTKVRNRRIQSQKAIAWLLNSKKGQFPLPCKVSLIRVGRKCDYDNLVYSFKSVRDEVANIIIPGLTKGKADESPLIQWEYKQEPRGSRPQGFRIEIYSAQEEVHSEVA